MYGQVKSKHVTKSSVSAGGKIVLNTVFLIPTCLCGFDSVIIWLILVSDHGVLMRLMNWKWKRKKKTRKKKQEQKTLYEPQKC